MKLYLKYTTLVFLKIFLVMVGALTLTATLVQVMLFLSVSLNNLDLDLFSVIKFMALCIPSIFVYVSPIALICTILYCFNLLSADNELLIFELSGISKFRLSIPAFSMMFAVTLLSFVMCFFVNPICKKQLLMQRETLHKNMINSVLKEKTFTKISNNLILYIETRLNAKDLRGVIIYDKTNPAEVTTIFAEKGSLLDEQDTTVFKLYDGSRQTLTQKNLQTLYFKSLIFDVSEYTKKFASFDRSLESQSINRLIRLRRKKANDLNYQKKVSQEIHRRISWPLLNISLPILFLFSALSFVEGRDKTLKTLNVLISITLSVLSMILYFSFINRINTKTNFSVLTYLDILLFSGIGFFLLKNVDSSKIKRLLSFDFKSTSGN
jgi:lipopolysaccharide export system permease protein